MCVNVIKELQKTFLFLQILNFDFMDVDMDGGEWLWIIQVEERELIRRFEECLANFID